jgi:hypothetical protein
VEDQFHVDHSSCLTTQEPYEDIPALDLSRPWQTREFVIQIQQLLGADAEPDSLFFVESWSLGGPAAVENFQRRTQEHSDRKRKCNALNDVINFRSLSFIDFRSLPFIQEQELNAEILSPSRATAIARSHDASSPPPAPESSAPPAQDSAPRDCRTFAEEYGSGQETTLPLNQRRACQLLGVTASSTHGEIKAAYWHMVKQWHPDRVDCKTQEERQIATEMMVAINAAYRLLPSGQRQKSA